MNTAIAPRQYRKVLYPPYLRLVTTSDPDMADFTHPHTATQHFRRKPPRQVRRDQRRAAERTRQNPEASEHSPSGLFQPTPPPTTTVAAHLEMQSENDTQHMYASDTDTDARASRSPDYSAPASSRPCDTVGVSLSHVSQSLDFSAENLMAWKGFSDQRYNLFGREWLRDQQNEQGQTPGPRHHEVGLIPGTEPGDVRPCPAQFGLANVGPFGSRRFPSGGLRDSCQTRFWSSFCPCGFWRL